MQTNFGLTLAVVAMCLGFSLQQARSQDEDLEKRLAYLQLERDDLDRRKFSVLIEKNRMTEVPIPIKETGSFPKDFFSGTFATEKQTWNELMQSN